MYLWLRTDETLDTACRCWVSRRALDVVLEVPKPGVAELIARYSGAQLFRQKRRHGLAERARSHAPGRPTAQRQSRRRLSGRQGVPTADGTTSSLFACFARVVTAGITNGGSSSSAIVWLHSQLGGAGHEFLGSIDPATFHARLVALVRLRDHAHVLSAERSRDAGLLEIYRQCSEIPGHLGTAGA